MNITMAHGSGGEATSKLIGSIFAKHFSNEYLDKFGDSGVVPGASRLAMTTDSFVVKPIFFRGGDIGRLAVCGTVNDLLMSGAVPKYLTAGFILEEGLDVDDLEKVVISLQKTAEEAGVQIVTGDTKVVETGSIGAGSSVEGKGGIIINTAGVGFVPEGRDYGPDRIETGDVIILSGNIGDHHAAIMADRLGIENDIVSDVAPLNEMVLNLMEEGISVHAMRDVTRGGLGTVLNEFAAGAGKTIEIEERKLPVSDAVRDFCGILGLDILYTGNEGKMVVSVSTEDEETALQVIRRSRYGENAVCIGKVGNDTDSPSRILRTGIGGLSTVGPLYGEGLPRIC